MRGSASGRLVLDERRAADARVAETWPARPTRAGRRPAPGSGSRSRATYLGIGEGARTRGRALGARPSPGRRLDERRRPAERPDPARSPRRGAARGADRRLTCCSVRRRQWDDARDGRRTSPLAKLVCHAGRGRRRRTRRSGSPAARVPRRTARAGVPRRARRADQPAARGRRAGRVRGGAAGTGARLVERLTAHEPAPRARPTPAVGAGSRWSSSRCTGRARGRTCRDHRSRTACSRRTAWSCRLPNRR